MRQAKTVRHIFGFTSTRSSGRAYTRAPILRHMEMAYLAFWKASYVETVSGERLMKAIQQTQLGKSCAAACSRRAKPKRLASPYLFGERVSSCDQVVLDCPRLDGIDEVNHRETGGNRWILGKRKPCTQQLLVSNQWATRERHM